MIAQASTKPISGGAVLDRPLPSKSLLFATTALFGGGLTLAGGQPAHAQEGEEQRIKLELQGFLNNFYAFTKVDEAGDEDFNEFTTHFDGEIQFRGSTTLKSGVEFGAQAELELPSQSNSNATIDEVYMWVESSLGHLRLGGDNTAMYQMGVGTFSGGGIGVPINSGWISDFIPQPSGFTNAFRSPAMSTAIDIVNDDNVFTYFSPRIAGFQFGASYAPRASFSGKPIGGPVNSNASFDSADDRYENGFSFGANWLGDVAGFSLGFSAGYAQAFANDAVKDIGGDDIQQLMVGGKVGFAGFTFDASYANELDGRRAGSVAEPISTEGESWLVGLKYQTGPWQFSGSYMQTEVESSVLVSGDDELKAAAGSVSYGFGPGIVLAGTLLYAEWDEETNGEQDGISLASGLMLGF